jgi:hypothetical protein
MASCQEGVVMTVYFDRSDEHSAAKIGGACPSVRGNIQVGGDSNAVEIKYTTDT